MATAPRPLPEETTTSDEEDINAVETALRERPEILAVHRPDPNEEPVQASVGETHRGRYPEEYDLRFVYGETVPESFADPSLYPVCVAAEVSAVTGVDVEWRGDGNDLVKREEEDDATVRFYSCLHIVRERPSPLSAVCRILMQHESVTGAFWRQHWREGQPNWWLTDSQISPLDYSVRLDLDWTRGREITPRDGLRERVGTVLETIPIGTNRVESRLSEQVNQLLATSAKDADTDRESELLSNTDCIEVGFRETVRQDDDCVVTAALDVPAESRHF